MEGEEDQIEPPEVPVEVDPDDHQFDLDADETFDDDDIANDELLAARGGDQWITRRDLKDPVHGAKYQSLLRRMGKARSTVRERETALATREQQIAAAQAKFAADRASWASEMVKGGAKPPAMKGDPKATIGRGAVQQVAAGKGAQQQPAGGKALPQTWEEMEAAIADAADARLNARFGAYAEQETEAAKAQQAEADKQINQRWMGDTNAYFSDLWNKGAKNTETQAQHKAAKELLPRMWKAFHEHGVSSEMAGNNRWYADFALRVAGHEHAPALLNLFGTLDRGAMYKRKPEAVLAFLETTARELGHIPAAGTVTVPREVLQERAKSGVRPDGPMTKADLDKLPYDQWAAQLAANPAYVAMYPQADTET